MAAGKEKTDLARLYKGVKAIGSAVEIRIKPSEEDPEKCSILVVAGNGGAIVLFTDFLSLDEAIAQACRKLAAISSRMLAAVRDAPTSDAPPPPSSEDKKGS